MVILTKEHRNQQNFIKYKFSAKTIFTLHCDNAPLYHNGMEFCVMWFHVRRELGSRLNIQVPLNYNKVTTTLRKGNVYSTSCLVCGV